MHNPTGVSVIVCCYNSACRLPETIRHLARQQVPAHISWEINIINNASTDNTVQVAAEEWNKFNLPGVNFNIIDQSIPGLINARKKGVDCASFEYLLFCDDDNWLSPGYISAAFTIMDASPGIGVLGGCGETVAEQPARMDEKQLSQLNANGPQTWAETDHWVYGAGTLLRKSIFTRLVNNGWQQITAGRTGTSLLSGDDVEICFMFYLSGYNITADNRLTFSHFIPLQRQTPATISGMAFWLSYSYYLQYSYLIIINKESRSLNKISWELLKSHGKSWIKTIFQMAVQKLKSRNSPSAEQKNVLLRNYGMICSILQNRKKVIRHHRHILDVLKKPV